MAYLKHRLTTSMHQAGALVVARSPATAVAIVKETKTGHMGFSKVILGVTVSMDLVVIVIYTLTSLLCDALSSNGSTTHFIRVMGIFTAQVRRRGCRDVSSSLTRLCVVSQMFLSTSVGAVVGYCVLPLLLSDTPGLARRFPVLHSVWIRLLQPLLFVLLGFSFFPLAHQAESLLEPLIMCMVSGFVLVNFRGHAARERFNQIEDHLAETIHVVSAYTLIPRMRAHPVIHIAIKTPVTGLLHSNRRRVERGRPVQQRSHRDHRVHHACARHHRGSVRRRSVGR